MSNTFNFTAWFAGKQAVSFTLAVGIVFLFFNYQGIIYRANPENQIDFSYPFFLQVMISHLDSFFFSFATAIIIFQSQKEWQKILYCGMEGIMIFLNLNRDFLANQGLQSQFYLAIYVSIFSSFTLYYLGSLARLHNGNLKSELKPNPDSLEDRMRETITVEPNWEQHLNGNNNGKKH